MQSLLKKIVAAFSLSLLVTVSATSQTAGEAALAAVRRSDASARDANGNVARLAPAEHMRRAGIYLVNRAFAEARAHWQSVLDNYPQDPRAAEALLGIGRSYFLGKSYQDGYVVFN